MDSPMLPAERKAFLEKGAQGCGVQQRLHPGAAHEAAEHQVLQDAHAVERQRERIGAVDVRHPQVRPQQRQLPRRRVEVATHGGERGAVDGPCRRPSDDAKRRRTAPEAGQLADPFEHSRLIRATCPTSRQHQSKHRRMPYDLAIRDRDEAFRLADRVGVMTGGELLQVGLTSEVFACPHTNEAAEIVGIENKIDGVVESSKGKVNFVRIDDGKIYVTAGSRPGARVAMFIRADEIHVESPR